MWFNLLMIFFNCWTLDIFKRGLCISPESKEEFRHIPTNIAELIRCVL